MVSLMTAHMKKTLLLVFLSGVVAGFLKGLDLTEEEKRRLKKALFEIQELPRRVFI